jgi:hypothetical protein
MSAQRISPESQNFDSALQAFQQPLEGFNVTYKPKPPRHPGRGSIRARAYVTGRSGRCIACRR